MAKNSPFSGWQILFSKTNLAYYACGAIVMSIFSKAVYDLLTILVGKDVYSILIISFGSLVFMFGLVFFLNKLLYEWSRTSNLDGKNQPNKRKGLILLVSNEDVCREALNWHKEYLCHCWLICTGRSFSIAENLKTQYQNNSTTIDFVVISDQDVYNPMTFKKEVEEIYENLPEHFIEDDIILDFTGLTSIASVGAVLGCLKEGRHLQYVPGIFDKGLNAVKPLKPIEIEINFKPIELGLNGK